MKPVYSEGMTKSTETDMRLMGLIVSLTTHTAEEIFELLFHKIFLRI